MKPLKIGEQLKYKDAKKDSKGWVDPTYATPHPFDLVDIRTEDSIKKTTGWWTGFNWDGLHLKEETKVIGWKKREDAYQTLTKR